MSTLSGAAETRDISKAPRIRREAKISDRMTAQPVLNDWLEFVSNTSFKKIDSDFSHVNFLGVDAPQLFKVIAEVKS